MNIEMLIYLHGGDALEAIFILALLILGFVAIFSIPFILFFYECHSETLESKKRLEMKNYKIVP